MAKKGPANRHLHARTTFLYQASTYLTMQARTAAADSGTNRPCDGGHAGHARRLGSHLRAVSLKGQARLSADVKRSLCKTCNAILIPGVTSTHVLENKSKGGKKPWADVIEIECSVCGSKKRFPVGATRQQRKTKREAGNTENPELTAPRTGADQGAST